MINSFDIAGRLAIDGQSVDKLRLQARTHPDQALKAAAQQFEALFMNMLLKSMREATPKDGVFDSEQTRFYTSMLDQQLSQSLSTKGIGLADIMIRQLPRPAVPNGQPSSALPTGSAEDIGIAPQSDAFVPATPPEATGEDDVFDSEHLGSLAEMLDQELAQDLSAPGIGRADLVLKPLSPSGVSNGRQSSTPAVATAANTASAVPTPGGVAPVPRNQTRNFVSTLWDHAKAASQATGIPAQFMMAQAALESGWGKHEIRRADGNPSFNLFGIKAGPNWTGPVVEKVTTEYAKGVAQQTVEKFRVYSSYAEGFRDYSNLLLKNPRYAAVVGQRDAAGFAHGLKRAGYATDPVYADKLLRIIDGNMLRQTRTVKT